MTKRLMDDAISTHTTAVNTYIYAKDVRESNVKRVIAIQIAARFSSSRLQSTGSW